MSMPLSYDPRGMGDRKPDVVLRPAHCAAGRRSSAILSAASQPVVVQGGLTGVGRGRDAQTWGKLF